MDSANRILITPLDWGLGHASRCIPLIRELISLNAVPVLAGSGQSLNLLKMEFPKLETHEIPDFNVSYPEKGSFYLHFMLRFRKMLRQIDEEHSALQDLISRIDVDAIISDNRYGLYAEDIPSVLITHQLKPKLGMFSSLISPYLHRLINRFDHCWVPDYEGGDSLAGDLSDHEQTGLKNLMHIGPISRMTDSEPYQDKTFSALAILSGPEPQRTLFEKELVTKLSSVPGNHVLVRGTSEKRPELNNSNIEVFDLLSSSELQELINKSQYLISRAGYSSIMDFVQLGRTALLVATPGQTEQEYLAQFHADKDFFTVQKQGDLNLTTAMEKLNAMQDVKRPKKNQDLNQILVDFLASLY